MQRLEILVDVTDAVGTGEALRTAATVVLPDLSAVVPSVAMFGFPGGGYNRRYYDLQLPGSAGYSQAEHHASSGHVFVACDHLGIGDSDVPTRALDFEAVGRANAATATVLVARLRQGTLADGVPPLPIATAIAMGQSFGGFVLTIGQAIAPVFDGVAFLGWSGIETVPPWPDGVDLAAMMAGTAGDGLDHPMRPTFHYHDVPEEIVVADMTKVPGSAGSSAPWGAAHSPGGPALATDRGPLGPGVVAAEAAAISVPVLVACGEIDVVADPWAETGAYRSSHDVTVCVLRRMAHMHNFASTRRHLWDRLDQWATTVSWSKGLGGV